MNIVKLLIHNIYFKPFDSIHQTKLVNVLKYNENNSKTLFIYNNEDRFLLYFKKLFCRNQYFEGHSCVPINAINYHKAQ